MNKQRYLTNLLSLAAALLALAIALRFGVGSRWFGFYGWATLALAAIPLLGWQLLARYRDLSLSRWPIAAILLPLAIAALIQIGFWVAFFSSGPDGISLALGRAMVMPMIAPALPFLGGFMAVCLAWLVARGAMKRSG